jgi:hypothetical protein
MTEINFRPTDYLELSRQAGVLIDNAASGDYESCVRLLTELMGDQFPALIRDSNPVYLGSADWRAAVLRFVIQEYSGFSNAAIHMFLEARIRNHWSELTAEIVRNMDEEMGALTRGIPHLELMRHGYRVELGVETEGLSYTALTRDFIDRMSCLFRNPDNVFLAGVLLAFETTAVDEFRVVDRLLRRYKALSGGDISPRSLTGEYIAGHVLSESTDEDNDPEMDHRRGMIRAIGAHMNGQDLRALTRGFLAVCLELNRWWEQIGLEALQQEIRESLAHDSHTWPDPYKRLLQPAA